MAGVDDVVGVGGGVVGVAAGTGASASAAFTIARPGRHSHQTTECRATQHHIRSQFDHMQLGRSPTYTVFY